MYIFLFPIILLNIRFTPRITYEICIPETAKICAMLAFLKLFCVFSSMSFLYPSINPKKTDASSSFRICFVFSIIFSFILFDVWNIMLVWFFFIFSILLHFIVP